MKIFLDIDGVLADFDGHARRQGKLAPEGGLVWDALDHDWWQSMPAYDGARAFYDALTALAPVRFLTAAVLHASCFSGKAQWVQSFVPEKGMHILNEFIICPSQAKRDLARPDAILIDDRETNIMAWRDAGGIGVQHLGDYARTLDLVRASFK